VHSGGLSASERRGLLLQCTALLDVGDHPLLWSVAQAQVKFLSFMFLLLSFGVLFVVLVLK